MGGGGRIVLIEDLPSAFSDEKKARLRRLVAECARSSPCPVVLIWSQVKPLVPWSVCDFDWSTPPRFRTLIGPSMDRCCSGPFLEVKRVDLLRCFRGVGCASLS